MRSRWLVCSLVAAPALICAQTLLPLEEASARTAPDWAPAHAGRQVLLRGTVTAGPISVLDYAHLAIQDESGYGFVLDAPSVRLESFHPGDEIEAAGRIGHRAGLPVLFPDSIRKLGSGPSPAPRPASISELNTLRPLGLFVETGGLVSISSSNRGGEILKIADGRSDITVFLPFLARKNGSLASFRPGDRVRVTGIASQYSPLPPYNRSFQLMIGDATWVTLVQRPAPIPPWSLAAALLVFLAAATIWWLRERRLVSQPRKLRRLYSLGERLLSASSPEASAELLESSLPSLLGVSSVHLYLHDPESGHLHPVPTSPSSSPVSLNRPEGFLSRVTALCFVNNSLISISDSRRSPLLEPREPAPRSILVAPMILQSAPVGVLQLVNHDKPRRFSGDELAVVQHLANQAAIGFRLRERETFLERKPGAEQYAATLHLLRAARADFEGLIGCLRRKPTSAAAVVDAETQAFLSRAEHSLQRLARLTAPAQKPPAAPDLTSVLRAALNRRRAAWKNLGIETDEHFAAGTIPVAAPSFEWLEEVIEGVLQFSEIALNVAERKSLRIRLMRLAGKAGLEFAFPGASDASFDAEDSRAEASGTLLVLPLSICRDLLRSWGGDLRIAKQGSTGPCLEVDLPLAPARAPRVKRSATPSAPTLVLTILLLDHPQPSQPSLLILLSQAGHRCVLASSVSHASELLSRLRFDAVFCSQQTGASSWQGLLDACRRRGVSFVLLTPAESAPPFGVPSEPQGMIQLAWPGPADILWGVLEKLQERSRGANGYNED